MIRLLAQLCLSFLANAVGLLAADLLLDKFSIEPLSLIFAVIIFSITTVVVGPLVLKIALKNVPALVGGIALVTTFIGLFVTNIFTDGLKINGLSTWVVASLVVWVFGLIASVLLPLVMFKKVLDK